MNSDAQVKINGSPSISYHAMVTALVKVFTRSKDVINHTDRAVLVDDYANRLEICHAAMGIHTEAGEVADILKAIVMYNKPFDNEMRAALVKELGDVRFWMQDIQNKFFISDIEIVQGNADKLAKRYTSMQYSNTAAIAREDKKWFLAADVESFQAGRYIEGPFEHQYEVEAAAKNYTFCYVGQVEGK